MLSACLAGCTAMPESSSIQNACLPQWYQFVENQVQVADEQGHGPDIGSPEWQSAVEYRLGLRGRPDLPPATSARWCAYIDDELAGRGLD